MVCNPGSSVWERLTEGGSTISPRGPIRLRDVGSNFQMPLSSRREFITTASAAGSSILLSNLLSTGAAGAQGRRFEGIFPIMQTPFTDTGALDIPTLEREARFLRRIGVQGMTWPQGAS